MSARFELRWTFPPHPQPWLKIHCPVCGGGATICELAPADLAAVAFVHCGTREYAPEDIQARILGRIR